MEKKNKKCVKRCRVGGQAVMEGVMMKSEKGIAMAVRTSDGEIVSEYKPYESKAKKGTFLGLPIVRGVVAFIDSLSTGMKTITRSAELYGEEESAEEPSKFEKFLSEKLGKSAEDIAIAIGVILAVALSVFLFIYLPVEGAELILGENSASLEIWRSLIEGGLRLVIFICYILLCSTLKDIKRVFMYHGAEHKTISCYEAGDPLTPEYAIKHSRLHPRCGTNYMFLVMAVSIVVFTLISAFFPLSFITNRFLRVLARLAVRLVFLPIVAGISYEVLQAAAKSDNLLCKIIRAPGMGLQLITTREPTPDMIEVALHSFKLAMESIGEEVCIPGIENETVSAEQPSGESGTEAEGAVGALEAGCEPASEKRKNSEADGF